MVPTYIGWLCTINFWRNIIWIGIVGINATGVGHFGSLRRRLFFGFYVLDLK